MVTAAALLGMALPGCGGSGECATVRASEAAMGITPDGEGEDDQDPPDYMEICPDMTCEHAMPAIKPSVPDVNSDGWGRPLFDTWMDLSCDDTAHIQDCDASNPCDDAVCLIGTPGGHGVCAPSGDEDIWCDGEGEVMTYYDHLCWLCVDLAVHAAACCRYPNEFDCREWPYKGSSTPGDACARHNDCMDGLVCGRHRGLGYGICQCPQLDPETVTPPDLCFQY